MKARTYTDQDLRAAQCQLGVYEQAAAFMRDRLREVELPVQRDTWADEHDRMQRLIREFRRECVLIAEHLDRR